MTNTDPREVEKFSAAAARWWDPDGEFRTLHHINPTRIAYLQEYVELAGCRVLDVGCGGGVLTEGLAALGAEVTGIDASAAVLEVARAHGQDRGINYELATAEVYAQTHKAHFDVITCMELVEHVPDPASLIQACARQVKTGGHVFFSTINRTPRAYAAAVLGAEYVLGLLPRGTHDYQRFLRPSELAAWIRQCGLEVTDVRGMQYNPFSGRSALGDDPSVKYLLHARHST